MLVCCLLAIHLRSLDQFRGKVNRRPPQLCLCHQRKGIPHRLYNIRVNRWCKCERGEAQEMNPEVHHKKPFWIWKVPHLLWHTVVDSTDSLWSISNKDHLNCIYQNYSGEFFVDGIEWFANLIFLTKEAMAPTVLCFLRKPNWLICIKPESFK